MTVRDTNRSAWIWPWRPRARLRALAWRFATALEPAIAGRRWLVSSAAVGALPILAGFALGSWLHQPVTGMALALLILPCVAADRFFRAAGIVAIAVFSHSAVAIGIATANPERTAPILRGSSEYWHSTWNWVRHGADEEYRPDVWLPRHAALVAVATVFGYTSFGAVPFVRGIEEIDLMNFYVGQLIRASERPEMAVLFGWHPWSFVRGLAFAFIVFEVTSISFERFVGRTLSTRRRRVVRWTAGLSLVLLDGTIKVLFAPAIREQLYRNLTAGSFAGFGP